MKPKQEKYIKFDSNYALVAEPVEALAILKDTGPDDKLDYLHPTAGIPQRECLEIMQNAFIDKGPEGLLPQHLPRAVLYAIGNYDKIFINLYLAAVAYIKNSPTRDGCHFKVLQDKFTDYALNYKVACQTEYVRQMGKVDLTHEPTVDTVLDVPQDERTELVWTEEALMEYAQMQAENN
jgi:hypothetical protein